MANNPYQSLVLSDFDPIDKEKIVEWINQQLSKNEHFSFDPEMFLGAIKFVSLTQKIDLVEALVDAQIWIQNGFDDDFINPLAPSLICTEMIKTLWDHHRSQTIDEGDHAALESGFLRIATESLVHLGENPFFDIHPDPLVDTTLATHAFAAATTHDRFDLLLDFARRLTPSALTDRHQSLLEKSLAELLLLTPCAENKILDQVIEILLQVSPNTLPPAIDNVVMDIAAGRARLYLHDPSHRAHRIERLIDWIGRLNKTNSAVYFLRKGVENLSQSTILTPDQIKERLSDIEPFLPLLTPLISDGSWPQIQAERDCLMRHSEKFRAHLEKGAIHQDLKNENLINHPIKSSRKI